jgi:WD40 repeat protein/transcriptional regulator with XRE-family HTH domain
VGPDGGELSDAGRDVTHGRRGDADLPPGSARELVDLFRRLQQRRGLSVGQIAIAAGLSRSHVSEVLRGWKTPSSQAAATIARVLGASEGEASKARQWAGQARELRYYQRTHGMPSTSHAPLAASPGAREQPRPGRRSGTDAPAAQVGPVVEVFPVAIGDYADPGLPDLDAETRGARLVDLLAPFGGQYRPWPHPARERGADAVQRRLRHWSQPQAQSAPDDQPGGPVARLAQGSVLYWAGHGWSDGSWAALAHAESPAMVAGSGVEPLQLAAAIQMRQAAAQPADEDDGVGCWAVVVLETSYATQIADAVMAGLHGPDAPVRVLLVAVPDDAAPAGGFPGVLAGLLADTFRTERHILLRDLAGQLERVLGPGNVHQRGLGEAALVRTWPPVASWMSAPVDTVRHLEDVLASLSSDERSHFVAKAQGAEHGELSWFFEGRQHETARISAWLRQASAGMLVVTGRAGSGKSALLGQVLVLSLPGLRDALARRGLITVPEPAALPPDDVFDAVIHLSGLTLPQAARRVAAAAGLGRLPSQADPAFGLANDLDWLAAQLPALVARRDRPLTILADALDEATDPLDTARSLLARIAGLPGVRVVAGTRASTHETPDAPASDRNLLTALGANPGGGSEHPVASTMASTVRVTRDPDAIDRYVAGRLRHARDYGTGGHAIPGLDQVRDADIDRVAAAVADRDREFLYARLAVYELIADPSLMRPGRAASLGHLLNGDHQDLFATALDRLARLDDFYIPLIQALALARGRGIPEADGIWAAIAARLTHPAEPGAAPARADRAWARAIHGLLEQAAAYIAVDAAASVAGRRTVYRLAHRTFTEYFIRTREDADAHGDRQCRCATALLGQARQVAAIDPAGMPGYLARHLSGHIADTSQWDDLAATPAVLDGLDPVAVTADALRTLFGHRAVPPPVAGVIGARDELLTAPPADRAGLRQLASTTHSPRHVPGEPSRRWGVAAARAGQVSMHIRLTGHTAIVCSVCAVPLPDGRVAVASASDDGTIRLWDLNTATPIGSPLTGHTGTVEDICTLTLPGQKVVLASASGDGTVRVWDPFTGRPIGEPLTGHAGTVYAVCAVPGAGGASRSDGGVWIASAGIDGTVRVWDPVTSRPVGQPLTGHGGRGTGVCAVPGTDPAGRPDGRSWIAFTGLDGTVRVWDPVTGRPVGRPLTGHFGRAPRVCAVPVAGAAGHPDGRTWIASTGDDGTVRVWDPVTSRPVGRPLIGHVGGVYGVCAIPGTDPAGRPDGRTWIASTGLDGTVRVWDPVTSRPVGQPLIGHAGPVYGVCAVPGAGATGRPDGPTWIASAGADGTVRVWDPLTSSPADQPLTGRAGPMYAVCTVPGTDAAGRPDGRNWIASTEADGTVRVWDPLTGCPVGQPLTDRTYRAYRMCAIPGTDPAAPSNARTWIASTGSSGTIRVWDPLTGCPVGQPLTGHTDRVNGLCAIPGASATGCPDEPAWIASAGADGTVRVWDPVTSRPVGQPLTGHADRVYRVCAIPRAAPDGRTWIASTAADGTVRVWDPVAGRPVGEPLTGHTGGVYGLCAIPGTNPDGRPWIASTGADGTVRVWDPVAGRPVGEPLTGHTGGVYGLCAIPGTNPDGRPWIASTGDDGTVRVWDPAGGCAVGEPLTGHAGPVTGVCAVPGTDPDGRTWIASTGADGTVRVWDPVTGCPVGEPLSASLVTVTALLPVQTPEAACVVVHSAGHLNLWNPASASLIPIATPISPVSAFTEFTTTSSPGPQRVIARSTGQLAFITSSQCAADRTPQAGSDAALALLPLPGPPARLACAVRDGTIALVHAETLRLAGTPLTGHTGPVRALCLLPQVAGSPIMASAGNDATIRLWDVDRGRPLGKPLTGHAGWIWSLTAVPVRGRKSRLLASAGADGTIRLWDPETGQSVAPPLEGHTDQVRAVTVAVADDGSTLLVSGSHDGTVRLWHPATGQAIQAIPLGIPVHALLQQPPDQHSRQRASNGATVTVGLRTGILSLDLNRSLFPAQLAVPPG